MYLSSDVAAAALRIPLQQPPGQRFDYNNANTQLLSLVLERATGRPLPCLSLSAAVATPAGRKRPDLARSSPRSGQALLLSVHRCQGLG
ncbi:serine hydrolase [Halomicronema hongdechloris]|uniref:serine hydrolase n=1 Tax=Halomicronema hongdechloris TaxID=1209493 RepID=UPI0010CC18AD